jgi:hypothetical protein
MQLRSQIFLQIWGRAKLKELFISFCSSRAMSSKEDEILDGQENTITLAAPISLSPTLKPLFNKPFNEKHKCVQGMKTYLLETKMT